MSEGMESNNLWHGIPIYSVRGGYFIDALKTLNTLRHLTVNGKTIHFADQNSGRVIMDGSYLNWQFVCPLGAFDPADFTGKNIGEFFIAIANYTRIHTIKSWEEFNTFLSNNASMINTVLGLATSGYVTAPNLSSPITLTSMPTYSATGTFSDLMMWIYSILPPEMRTQSASVMQSPTDNGNWSLGVVVSLTINAGSAPMEQSMSFSFIM